MMRLWLITSILISRCSAQYKSCYRELGEADDNGDKTLSRPEYAKFVHQLSRQTIDFAKEKTVPPEIVSTYIEHEDKSLGGISLEGIQPDAHSVHINEIDSFCYSVFEGMSARFDTSTTSGECSDALATGASSNGGGETFARSHFFVFLNELVKAGEGVPFIDEGFDVLPNAVKEVFDNFATNDVIDKGLFTTIEAISQICIQSLTAVSIHRELTLRKAEEGFNDASYATCVDSLRPHDGASNEKFNRRNYATYVSASSNGAYNAEKLVDLPEEFELLFQSLGKQQALISMPGLQSASPSSDEKTFIFSVCSRTKATISGQSDPGGPTPPTDPPVVQNLLPTNAPVSSGGGVFDDSSYTTCVESLRPHDGASNEHFNRKDYAGYVSVSSNGAYNAEKLVDLPEKFELLFQSLGKQQALISMPGLQSATPSSAEKTFIFSVCTRTQLAISGGSDPNAPTPTDPPQQNDEPPTGSPVQNEPPTAPPIQIEISAAELTRCGQMAMTSDGPQNVDDMLEPTEYIQFLLKLSPGLFPSSSQFVNIGPNFRQVYDDLKGTNGLVDITASKAWKQPTPAQKNILRALCGRSLQAIEDSSQPVTSAPTPLVEEADINATYNPSPTFFLRCKASMRSSDGDGSTSLDSTEYVRFLNLLTRYAFNGKAYADLPTAFRASFDELKDSTGRIDITGASTQVPNSNLSRVCAKTEEAITQYENSVTATPTVAPTLLVVAPTSIPIHQATETPAPLMSAKFRNDCRLALIIADTGYDSNVNSTEYVRFLNFLLKEKFQSFEGLSPPFKEAYANSRQGNDFILTSGIRPGQRPTTEESDRIDVVCAETKRAADRVETGSFPTQTPSMSPEAAPVFETSSPTRKGAATTLPTLGPTSRPTLSESQYQTCRSAMIRANLDHDGFFSEVEYTRFVNHFRQNDPMHGTAIDSLDPVFSALYNRLRVRGSPGVVIEGATSPTPSPLQAISLRHLCSSATIAFQLFDEEAGASYSQRCFNGMLEADGDGDGLLDEFEFEGFFKTIGGRWKNTSTALLPYQVRESFNRATSGKKALSLQSLSTQNSTEDDLFFLKQVCENTRYDMTITASTSPISLVDHCSRAIVKGDMNADEELNGQEFVQFVSNFALQWQPGSRFQDMDVALASVFDEYKTVSNETGQASIPVGGVSNEGEALTNVALQMFCTDIEKAVRTARFAAHFLPRCQVALGDADDNDDSFLDQAEYLLFLSHLSDLPIPISFEALQQPLQEHFKEWKGTEQSVNIEGLQDGLKATLDQQARFRDLCLSTYEALDNAGASDPPTQSPSLSSEEEVVAEVFNAFVVANTNGLTAFDIQTGQVGLLLQDAYKTFINERAKTMFSSENRNLRSRKLGISRLVDDSPRIVAYEDTGCPESSSSARLCVTAYSTFSVILDTESSKESSVILATGQTQAAIAAGELQETLKSSSSVELPVTIVGAAENVRPVPPDNSDNESGSSTSTLLMAVAAGVGGLVAAILVLMLVWFCRRRSRRRQVVEPAVDKIDKQEPESFLPNLGATYEPSRDQSDKPNRKPGFGVFSYDDDSKMEQDTLSRDSKFNPSTTSFFDTEDDKEGGQTAKANMFQQDQNNAFESSFHQMNQSSSFGQQGAFEGREEQQPSPSPFEDGGAFAVDPDFGSVGVSSTRSGQEESSYNDSKSLGSSFLMNLKADTSSHRSYRSREESGPSSGYHESSSTEGDGSETEYEGSTAPSLTSEQRRQQSRYRPQIERLVQKLMPDELENVDDMMQQFVGREDELVSALNNLAGSNEDKTMELTTASDIFSIPERETSGHGSSDSEGEEEDGSSESEEDDESEYGSEEEDESKEDETESDEESSESELESHASYSAESSGGSYYSDSSESYEDNSEDKSEEGGDESYEEKTVDEYEEEEYEEESYRSDTGSYDNASSSYASSSYDEETYVE